MYAPPPFVVDDCCPGVPALVGVPWPGVYCHGVPALVRLQCPGVPASRRPGSF